MNFFFSIKNIKYFPLIRLFKGESLKQPPFLTVFRDFPCILALYFFFPFTLFSQTVYDDYKKIDNSLFVIIQNDSILKKVQDLVPVSQTLSFDTLYSGFSGIKFGVFSGLLFNSHNANFHKLPGVPNCCPRFETGYGKGFQAGAHLDYNIYDFAYLALRIGYYSYDAILSFLEKKEQLVRVGDAILPGSFKHTLITELSDLALEPLFGFSIIEGLTIYAGAHLGYLVNKKFHQYETLKEPKDYGVFVDTDTRKRNDTSGIIPKTIDIRTGLVAGISWELPLNKNKSLALCPELFYYDGFDNYVSGLKWQSGSFRASLSLKFTPRESVLYRENKELHYIDTILISSDSVFQEEIRLGKVSFVDNDETIRDSLLNKEIKTIVSLRTDTIFKRTLPRAEMELNVARIQIKTSFTTEIFPILPYIFFTKSSDTISDFFVLDCDTSTFEIDSIISDPIEFHKYVLSIIGKRLKTNPEQTISLTGSADITTEQKACWLARKRAEKVRDYFLSHWGIDSSRITIEKSKGDCYPDNPTISMNDSAYIENQRVMIASKNKAVFEPITRRHEPKLTEITPGIIVATTKGSTEKGIVKTQLLGFQDGKILFSKVIDNINDDINYEIDKETALSIHGGAAVSIMLILTDTLGRTAEVTKELTVKKDTSEIEIERLSLILFDVSEDQLPNDAKIALTNFLKELSQDSEIRVKGFADLLGSQSVNERLSTNRAENTAKIIRDLYPQANIVEVKGFAGNAFPAGIYSYSTPTERFLSRSVQIEIYKKR